MFTPVDGDAMDFAPMDSSSYPAGELRRRLTHGRGRLLVLVAISLVWLMDICLLRQLEHHHEVANTFNAGLSGVERLSTLVFVIVTLGLSVSLFRGGGRNLFRWALVYLILSMVQVVANVLSMVATASAIHGGGLTGLWDVAAVYMQSVIVFMFIYIFLDVSTPGGAFVWPTREGECAAVPHVIDYLFISLNVNSTYGPTSEALVSRPAKLFMALQVLLAILMLTVLIARAVSA